MERKIKARNWAGGLQANKTVIHIHSCKLAQKAPKQGGGEGKAMGRGGSRPDYGRKQFGCFFFLSHIHLDKNNKD